MKWFNRKTKQQANDQSKYISHNGITISLDELINLHHIAHGIELFAHKRVLTDRAGGHTSGFKGRGIDFEEVRVYQPGDDIRLMDWRVTARTGEPHTKIFHEERERPVFLLVDESTNMFFGTKVAFKSVIAAQAAAIMAWAAVNNGDRIGGIIFSDNKCQEYRPRSRKFGVLPLLKGLSEATDLKSEDRLTGNQSNGLDKALARLRHVIRPGSLVIILSDFAGLNDTAEKHLNLIARHCEVLAGFVYDPLEKIPPPPNRYSVSNGQEMVTMDTRNLHFCNEYQQRFEHRLQYLTDLLHRNHIPMMQVATNDNVVDVIKRGFWEWR